VIYKKIIKDLNNLADTNVAEKAQRFFKTGIGEYGYGDKFLGIRVPVLRKTVKLFQDTAIGEIVKLLKSEYHEVRLFALFLLIHQFQKASEAEQDNIFHLYLSHTKYINNWDLVDSSAHHIVGAYLFDKSRAILYELAKSTQLWERRIAIMSTFYFIKNEQFHDTLKLAKILINDPEDLIHKAVGWMLREVGNRDIIVEEKYLRQHYQAMPRTMLRYSIEKFSKNRRQMYLKGEVK